MPGLEIEGLPKLALYRVESEFHCSQDLCTHGGKFDIRTGGACAHPCTEALRTFPVIFEDGDLFIDLP